MDAVTAGIITVLMTVGKRLTNKSTDYLVEKVYTLLKSKFSSELVGRIQQADSGHDNNLLEEIKKVADVNRDIADALQKLGNEAIANQPLKKKILDSFLYIEFTFLENEGDWKKEFKFQRNIYLTHSFDMKEVLYTTRSADRDTNVRLLLKCGGRVLLDKTQRNPGGLPGISKVFKDKTDVWAKINFSDDGNLSFEAHVGSAGTFTDKAKFLVKTKIH